MVNALGLEKYSATLMPLLLIFARIIVFVLIFAALLRVKKTRVRHLPSRRTRVSRHHGETCVWLERLTSAVLDMFHCALQEDAPATEESNVPLKGHPISHGFSLFFREYDGSERGSESSGMRPLLRLFEDRVKAFLEDRGIATYASFTVNSVGRKPPIVRAIRVTNLTETEMVSDASAVGTATTSLSDLGAGVGVGNSSFAAVTSAATGVTTPACTGGVGEGVGVAELVAPQMIKHRTSKPPPRLQDESGDKWRNETYTDDVGMSGVKTGKAKPSSMPPCPLTAIELEAEVEYAGGLDMHLQADVCLARGRRLPVFIRVSDIEYVKAHVRVRATLERELATMDSRRRPYLKCILWLESEPAFSFKMSTFLSRYRIQDFFAVPVVLKMLFLRFINHRILYPHGAGVSFDIPLPGDVVDGGIQPWWVAGGDLTTGCGASVRSFATQRGAL
ncbi:transmembrane protein conserved [Trypanosoma vivax]|uniref:Uncharacterized protein n=1 Tax=Trypanosoma vivax (strain Y486) TaxID=1055687 RepID=G0TR42_TRYVY|nr:hypothetical protein TRVL_01625 [Trypanosoma vivax]KAH8611875.1 transmembrane protein conserved [Trypanosoma vivax]CCC46406.1 conserved hypothetical protein [Trypanosoma vivax Y486]